MGLLGCQMATLLRRNYLLKMRNKRQAFQELIIPVYFVAILALVRLSIKNETFPQSEGYASVPIDPGHAWLPPPRGLLAYSAANITAAADVMGRVADKLALNSSYLMPFATSDDMEAYYRVHPSAIWAGVAFADDFATASALRYFIRMNGSLVPSTRSGNQMDPQISCRSNSSGPCQSRLYISSGFSTLQVAVDAALLETTLAQASVDATVDLMVAARQAPMVMFTQESSYYNTVLGLYMVLAFSPFITFLIVNLVTEKEKKIKEGMKMMGLSDAAYVLSWALTYAVITAASVVLVTALAVAARLFQHSSVVIIFPLVYFYCLSLVAIAFIVVPFFNKAQTAGTVGSLIVIALSLISLPLRQLNAGMGAKVAASLISPVAFSLGLDAVAQLEARGVGATPATASSVVDGYAVSYALGMMALDVVLYLGIAYYLDSVVPAEYGRAKKWYFPLQAARRLLARCCAGAVRRGSRARTSPPESAMTAAGRGDEVDRIEIENLCKVYDGGSSSGCWARMRGRAAGKGGTVALDHVSLAVHRGEIFALLGHNGAGKTTLVAILTGLAECTSGDVVVGGLDVRTDMAQIRHGLGICPQHDILFEQLTVQEHLIVYAGIKGIRAKDAEARLAQAVNDVDLAPKLHERANTLSGGQKRKLSVAMALIGDPDILILDEPTSGMDPYSRRRIWTLLRSRKDRRFTILTTHFMDEADVLADRKAVLSHGRVKAMGTSLALKNRFGVGYRLGVAWHAEGRRRADLLDKLVKEHIPSAALAGRQHGQETAYRLPLAAVAAFPGLFAALDKCKEDLGISSFGVSMTTLEEVFLRLEDAGHGDDGNDDGLDGGGVADGGAAAAVAPPARGSSVASSIAAGRDSRASRVPLLSRSRRSSGKAALNSPLWSLMRARFLMKFRNPRALFYGLVLPVLFTFLALGLTKAGTSTAGDTFPPLVLNTSVYGNSTAVGVRTAAPAAPGAWDDHLGYPTVQIGANASVDAFMLERAPGQAAIDMAALSPESISYTLSYNATLAHSLPVFVAAVNGAVMQWLASNTSAAPPTIVAGSHPLPYREAQVDWASYTAVLLVGIGISSVPGGFAIGLVTDRKLQAKFQLYVMGCSVRTYWLSSFVVDVTFYAMSTLALLFAAPAFGFTAFSGVALLPMVLLFAVYIPMIILFSYVLSFAFEDPETCQTVLPALVNLAAIIPYTFISIIDQADGADGYNLATALHYVFCVIDPPYVVVGGLYVINAVYLIAQLQYPPRSVTLR